MKIRARRILRWPALHDVTLRALSLLALLAIVLSGPHIPFREPALELQVEHAGCDPVVVPVDASHPSGIACELWGLSPFEGARGPKAPGTLTLWVEATEGARVVVAVDGRWSAPISMSMGEQRMLIAVDKGAREVTVTATLGPKIRAFRLPIVTAEASLELARLRGLVARRKRGTPSGVSPAEARRSLEVELEALAKSAIPSIRAKAIGQLGRVHLEDDDPKVAFDLFRRAMEADRVAGLVADEISDGIAFSVHLVTYHEIDEARAVLDHLDRLVEDYDVPAGAAQIPTYRASIAEALGDIAVAQRLMTISEERSTRLDLQGQLAYIVEQQRELLAMLGRYEEAKKYLDRAKPDDTNACARARYYNNLGWYRLLVGREEYRGAKVDLDKARRLFSAECDNKRELRNVLTNLAALALDLGELGDAERHLKEARDAYPKAPARMVAEWELIDARLHLERGQIEDAEASFRDVRELSKAAGLPDYALDAELGLAESLERSHLPMEALKAYAEADDQLDRWSQLIPFGSGKQSFFLRHRQGVERYLGLLFEQAAHADGGRDAWVRRMACVARRSQSRTLASMEWAHRLTRAPSRHADVARAAETLQKTRDALAAEAAEAHRLPSSAQRQKMMKELIARAAKAAGALDEIVSRVVGARPIPSCEGDASRGLVEPGASEVTLTYHPVGGDQWIGMAVSRSIAVAERFSFDPHPEKIKLPTDLGVRERWRAEMGAKLLSPFTGAFGDDIERVRIFAAEPVGLVDIHDLPLDGPDDTLASRFSVSYGVDLAGLAPAPRAKRALLVAVPTPELTMPPREVAHVREALERAGWSVRALVGEEATLAAVLRELAEPGLELFHYAGHGAAEGVDGWESHVMLAQNGWLSVPDVTALPRAPRLVVLSSCDAANAKDHVYVDGPSLAHAFLVAGAERVIGSPHRNNDATTMQVMKELYRNHLPALAADPSPALRDSFHVLAARPDMKNVSTFPQLRVIAR